MQHASDSPGHRALAASGGSTEGQVLQDHSLQSESGAAGHGEGQVLQQHQNFDGGQGVSLRHEDHFQIRQVEAQSTEGHAEEERSTREGKGADDEAIVMEAQANVGPPQGARFSVVSGAQGTLLPRMPSFKSKPPASLDIVAILREEDGVDLSEEALVLRREDGWEVLEVRTGNQETCNPDASTKRHQGAGQDADTDVFGGGGESLLGEVSSAGPEMDTATGTGGNLAAPEGVHAGLTDLDQGVSEAVAGLVHDVAASASASNLLPGGFRGQSVSMSDDGDGGFLAREEDVADDGGTAPLLAGEERGSRAEEDGELLNEAGDSFYGMAGGSWYEDVGAGSGNVSSQVFTSSQPAVLPTRMASAASSGSVNEGSVSMLGELSPSLDSVERESSADMAGHDAHRSAQSINSGGQQMQEMSRSFRLVADGSYDVRTVHQAETDKRVEVLLGPHVALLLSTAAAISSHVHLSLTAGKLSYDSCKCECHIP